MSNTDLGQDAYRLVDHLLWALDLLDMYGRRMVQLGDPQELVYSAKHVSRKSKARGVLEGVWQALNECSPCLQCRDGNIPLNRWHNYGDNESIPCKAFGTVANPNDWRNNEDQTNSDKGEQG